MGQPRLSSLQALDGTQLHVADWLVEAPEHCRGRVVLMHGLGEHCGRHAKVARFFNDCGWSVRTYDHRGHGRSGGPRGDVPQDDAPLQDAKIVVDDFLRRVDDKQPILLVGHSMGGLFAARFACAGLVPLRGLILSSPVLSIRLSFIQRLLRRVMTAVAPGRGVANGLRIRYLSHDPAVVAAYRADPLVHSVISARLINSMLAAVEYVQSQASLLRVPTLMVVSGHDRTIDASGSAVFFKKLAPGIGTMHLYDDMYHELFHEVESRRVFNDVRSWLDKLA